MWVHSALSAQFEPGVVARGHCKPPLRRTTQCVLKCLLEPEISSGFWAFFWAHLEHPPLPDLSHLAWRKPGPGAAAPHSPALISTTKSRRDERCQAQVSSWAASPHPRQPQPSLNHRQDSFFKYFFQLHLPVPQPPDCLQGWGLAACLCPPLLSSWWIGTSGGRQRIHLFKCLWHAIVKPFKAQAQSCSSLK